MGFGLFADFVIHFSHSHTRMQGARRRKRRDQIRFGQHVRRSQLLWQLAWCYFVNVSSFSTLDSCSSSQFISYSLFESFVFSTVIMDFWAWQAKKDHGYHYFMGWERTVAASLLLMVAKWFLFQLMWNSRVSLTSEDFIINTLVSNGRSRQ